MICKDKNWTNCQELYKRIGIIGMKGKGRLKDKNRKK